MLMFRIVCFFEDVNNLLNSGEIPNLFAADEKVTVCEMVRNDASSEGKAGTINLFPDKPLAVMNERSTVHSLFTSSISTRLEMAL